MAYSGSKKEGGVQDNTNNQRLTNLLLNGVNYLPWSRAVTIALGGRSRQGHITGKTKAPKETDPTFDEWQASDHSVMSWIFNSMEPQIYEIFAYLDTAKDLWDSLYEMYGQANNASRVFELQQGLASSKQGMNQSFTEHLGKMKKQWEELRQYRPVTQNVRDYVQREEQDRIFQLLASLKPEFEETKRDILMRSELPSFNTVCSIIQNEETRKRVMTIDSNVKASIDSLENSAHYTMSNFKQGDASNRWAKGKGKKPIRFHCDHCNRDGHSKERCWVLNPQLRPSKDKSPDAKVAIQGNATEFQSKLEFLTQQVQQLLQTHGQGLGATSTKSGNLAKTSGNIHALSTKVTSQIIVDSGATDHMCSSSDMLYNTVFGTLYPPITIANGVQVPTQGMGQVNILSKRTEALIVPGLKTNLSSVSKCAK